MDSQYFETHRSALRLHLGSRRAATFLSTRASITHMHV